MQYVGSLFPYNQAFAVNYGDRCAILPGTNAARVAADAQTAYELDAALAIEQSDDFAACVKMRSPIVAQ